MAKRKEFRVTVETLQECYEYSVLAACAHDAIEEGEALARQDGLSPWANTYSRADRVS